jgi:lambda repressor-like predicted transcriptional regulator
LFVVYLRLWALPSLRFQVSNQNGFRPFCLPTAQGSRKGKPMNEEPHIGKLIKAELAQQGRSITWLATQLGYSRQYMYKLFRRKWIYTDLLLKISDLLDYDFFRCYSEWREQRDIITTKSSSWKE